MRPRCCKWWVLGIPPTWLVVCGIILVQVVFGLYPTLVKDLARTDSPLVFSFYRDLCGVPLLFLCAFITERKIMIPGPKMLLIFMALGLTGIFGNQLLYILGVYWAGPNIASAFQPIIPVWTTILAVLTCTEKLPSPLHVHMWVKLLGIVLATGGAIELTLTGTKDNSTYTDNGSDNSTSLAPHTHPVSLRLLGYICLVANTFLTASYLLIQKRFIFKVHQHKWKDYPVYITAYSYLFGAIYMGIANIYHLATRNYKAFIIPSESICALIYAVFMTSAVAYMLMTWSNMHLSTTVVTAFWPLQVLVTVIASYFIVHDQLEPLQYIGAVMLVVALFLVLFSNHMEERLRDGRSVLRVDCRMTRPALLDVVSINDGEETALLHSRQREGVKIRQQDEEGEEMAKSA